MLKQAATSSCCARCGKDGAKGRCTACRSVLYCGPECQKEDWKTHKKACNDLQQQQRAKAEQQQEQEKNPANSQVTKDGNVKVEHADDKPSDNLSSIQKNQQRQQVRPQRVVSETTTQKSGRVGDLRVELTPDELASFTGLIEEFIKREFAMLESLPRDEIQLLPPEYFFQGKPILSGALRFGGLVTVIAGNKPSWTVCYPPVKSYAQKWFELITYWLEDYKRVLAPLCLKVERLKSPDSVMVWRESNPNSVEGIRVTKRALPLAIGDPNRRARFFDTTMVPCESAGSGSCNVVIRLHPQGDYLNQVIPNRAATKVTQGVQICTMYEYRFAPVKYDTIGAAAFAGDCFNFYACLGMCISFLVCDFHAEMPGSSRCPPEIAALFLFTLQPDGGVEFAEERIRNGTYALQSIDPNSVIRALPGASQEFWALNRRMK